MAQLEETLNRTRAALARARSDTDPHDMIAQIEGAGAQVGELQVTCCTLTRMPFYTEILTELTKVQRTITTTYDLGH